MKKKQWIIGLIVLGIIVVGIGICTSLQKDYNKPLGEQEEFLNKDNETEFVPFVTDEEENSEHSKKDEDIISDEGDLKKSDTGDSDVSSSQDTNSPSTDEISDGSETDSTPSDEPNENTRTELPFVPFD